MLVPQRAVMREANGTPYVYVVEDGKIAIRRLVTHRTQGQNWIVEEGLKPGEKVVIEGLQRIRPVFPSRSFRQWPSRNKPKRQRLLSSKFRG